MGYKDKEKRNAQTRQCRLLRRLRENGARRGTKDYIYPIDVPGYECGLLEDRIEIGWLCLAHNIGKAWQKEGWDD